MPVIVLAGGRSRRFGGDKLAARVKGSFALARVIARLEPLASEVIVSVPSERRRKELARLVPPSVRFLLDQPRRWGEGPAGAIARGRDAVPMGPVLFVPGDVPWIETRALGRLVRQAQAGAADVAVPYWQSGETEHLIQWHRSRDSLRHLDRTVTGLPSSRRASEFLRAVPRTILVPVRRLSDDPRSFSHLTYPSDVDRPPLRGRAGRSARVRVIVGTPKRWYRAAGVHLRAHRPLEAAHAFLAESRWYARANLPLLAQHALEDAVRAAARPIASGGAGVPLSAHLSETSSSGNG